MLKHLKFQVFMDVIKKLAYLPTRHLFDHSKTGQVRFSDGHCNKNSIIPEHWAASHRTELQIETELKLPQP